VKGSRKEGSEREEACKRVKDRGWGRGGAMDGGQEQGQERGGEDSERDREFQNWNTLFRCAPSTASTVYGCMFCVCVRHAHARASMSACVCACQVTICVLPHRSMSLKTSCLSLKRPSTTHLLFFNHRTIRCRVGVHPQPSILLHRHMW